MKTCANCEEKLPVKAFNKNSRTSDGRQSYCRECQRSRQSEYYQKNKSELNRKRIEFRNSSESQKEKDRAAQQRWIERNPEKYKEIWKRTNRRYKEKVLLKISDNLKCARCGCNRMEFLEINHKNGGGAQEYKHNSGNNKKFYAAILKDERTTDDLEILCKPCNSIHYLELKSGGKLPYELKWNG